jgi:hypothetical protein
MIRGVDGQISRNPQHAPDLPNARLGKEDRAYSHACRVDANLVREPGRSDMDWLTFTSKLIGAIAWPIAAFAVVLLLREQIKAMLA